MSVEHVILCGSSAAVSGGSNKGTVRLHLWGTHANVTLKISDISEKMATNIPPVLVDLLEIATYVYCADQATTRGAGNTRHYGAQWRRRFTFHIPVREPDMWSSRPVLTALQETLGFLSDDEYEFTFTKLTDPPAVAQYLDFGSGEASGVGPDEVILFSGGLDSLGGSRAGSGCRQEGHRARQPPIFTEDRQATEGPRGGSEDTLLHAALPRSGLGSQRQGAWERVHPTNAILSLRLVGGRGGADL